MLTDGLWWLDPYLIDLYDHAITCSVLVFPDSSLGCFSWFDIASFEWRPVSSWELPSTHPHTMMCDYNTDYLLCFFMHGGSFWGHHILKSRLSGDQVWDMTAIGDRVDGMGPWEILLSYCISFHICWLMKVASKANWVIFPCNFVVSVNQKLKCIFHSMLVHD